MLEEAGPIAGNTSLSRATMAIHASPWTPLSPSNTCCLSMLRRPAPEFLLQFPLLTDYVSWGMHCMAAKLVKDRRRCSLSR